jgi:hypothetical protein
MTCPVGVVIETIWGRKVVVVLELELELLGVAGAISSPRTIFPFLVGVNSFGLISNVFVAI